MWQGDVWQGACMAGGHAWDGGMQETRPLKRVVRIILQRFLVENSFSLIR